MDSKIKEIYAHPVGHDVIKKLLLQLNINESYVKWIGSLKLSTIQNLTHKQFDPSFYNSLITLMNTERDVPVEGETPIAKKWWKEAVFYQIYPKSFMDSNGDGIGDLQGILSKLDYLQGLGVDVIWLSPIYDSPNDDNGYDIRDYHKIMKEFGTMEDFDNLLLEVHKRGMRLIMDLVINHTSDEHEWYKQALADKTSKYRNYYHFKQSNDDNPPNNWTSFFSGSAWNQVSEKEWALHLFSKKQMDLNWENEALRSEIIQMIQWWLDKGVDGFRMDVVNYISKAKGLPDGNKVIGELMGYYGIEHYFYGPKLHEYLRQIRAEAFAPYDAYAIGEMPGIGMEMGKLLTSQERQELDMFFSFDHLEMPGKARFDEYIYDLNYYKKYLIEYTKQYGNQRWMSLFYNNHDNPRFISKIDRTHQYTDVLAKLLAMIQLTSKGTPYMFQGDEIGAVNQDFTSMEAIRDVESINLYHELCMCMSEEEAFTKILAGTRDHARVGMQWTSDGGFSQGQAWITGKQPSSVELQVQDEQSIYHFYKFLIQYRKLHQELIYGDIKFYFEKTKDMFVYARYSSSAFYVVECNLSNKVKNRLMNINKYELVLSNYQERERRLRAYECNLYRRIHNE